jgi:hypothetical protein
VRWRTGQRQQISTQGVSQQLQRLRDEAKKPRQRVGRNATDDLQDEAQQVVVLKKGRTVHQSSRQVCDVQKRERVYCARVPSYAGEFRILLDPTDKIYVQLNQTIIDRRLEPVSRDSFVASVILKLPTAAVDDSPEGFEDLLSWKTLATCFQIKMSLLIKPRGSSIEWLLISRTAKAIPALRATIPV